MANGIRCENCIVKCPQAKMAHEIAKGRMYATNEFIALQKKVESGELVEVVRCAQCCWNDRGGRCMNPKCGKSWYGCPVPDEHFCSYGEKREVE